MNSTSRPSIALVLVALALVLGGCTEEKAAALKTAAQSFAEKAVDAIDSYRELLIVVYTGDQTDAQRLQASMNQIKALALRKKPISDDELKGAIAPLFARESALAQTKRLEEVRQIYQEFAVAFDRLPEGSFLATNAVTCSAALGARLIHRLAVFHDDLVSSPINRLKDLSERRVAIQQAAAKGSAADIERAALAYIEMVKRSRNDNEEARKKFALAIEAGDEVLYLVGKYGELDVATMLKGVNRILDLRAKHLGITNDESAQRVKQIRGKLESDDKYGPILKLPVATAMPECRN